MYNEMNLTEDERIKELEILKTSYQMYEKSKAETIKRRKEALDKYGNPMYDEKGTKETIELMDTMQQDIKDKYLSLGGDEKDLIALKPKGRKKDIDRKAIINAMKKVDTMETTKTEIPKKKRKKGEFKTYEDKIAEMENTVVEEVVEEPINNVEEPEETKFTKQKDFTPIINNTTETIVEDVPQLDFTYKPKSNGNIQYDVIPLPSRGECYADGRDKITVAYLTAYDENIILSPNLYKDGTFTDHILSNKILDDVDPDDLVKGDRDAIMLWLRASGYGNEYPIKVTDNETGEEFETIIDLADVKYKNFKLKSDENGYFDTILPVSKDIVKFRYLPNSEVKKLIEMRKQDDKDILTTTLKESVENINDITESLDDIKKEDKIKIQRQINDINDIISKSLEGTDYLKYNRDLTNKLALSIMSVNGISDRDFIDDYALNMNVRDASHLRKTITDNEPGLDYNITVTKPDSLGGGTMTTFLRLDQFIFLSVVQ